MAIDLTTGGYATVPDFDLWMAPAVVPANSVRLLRSASFRVAAACEISPYGDTPSDAGNALRDATCAQAAVWVELGISPDAVGVGTGIVGRSKILDGTVYTDTSKSAATLDAAINTLAPEALAILTGAGLIGGFAIADGGECFGEATEFPTIQTTHWPFW